MFVTAETSWRRIFGVAQNGSPHCGRHLHNPRGWKRTGIMRKLEDDPIANRIRFHESLFSYQFANSFVRNISIGQGAGRDAAMDSVPPFKLCKLTASHRSKVFAALARHPTSLWCAVRCSASHQRRRMTEPSDPLQELIKRFVNALRSNFLPQIGDARFIRCHGRKVPFLFATPIGQYQFGGGRRFVANIGNLPLYISLFVKALLQP